MSVVRLTAVIGMGETKQTSAQREVCGGSGRGCKVEKGDLLAFCVPGCANSMCKGPAVKLAWNVAGKMGQMGGSPRPPSEVAAKLSFWAVE